MMIRVAISGRHYDLAAGLPEELSLADGASVDAALAAVAGLLPAGSRLPASCLVAVSGEHLGTLASHVSRPLRDGDELLVIAPVAGG